MARVGLHSGEKLSKHSSDVTRDIPLSIRAYRKSKDDAPYFQFNTISTAFLSHTNKSYNKKLRRRTVYGKAFNIYLS